MTITIPEWVIFWIGIPLGAALVIALIFMAIVGWLFLKNWKGLNW